MIAFPVCTLLLVVVVVWLDCIIEQCKILFGRSSHASKMASYCRLWQLVALCCSICMCTPISVCSILYGVLVWKIALYWLWADKYMRCAQIAQYIIHFYSIDTWNQFWKTYLKVIVIIRRWALSIYLLILFCRFESRTKCGSELYKQHIYFVLNK